jgi:hypothetical protein
MKREQFLRDINPWGSHRALLWEALEATKDSPFPVIELGCGDNSTPFLMKYCEDNQRVFFSYDSDKAWADKYDSDYVKDWEKHPLWLGRYSVCLLDLAPGDYRRVALMKIDADIIVVHDSEPPGWNASDYKVRPLFKNFKYVKDDVPKEKGQPWTTALSNTIDVTKWDV